MKEFKLAFGRGVQSVMLPEDHISDVLEGVPTPACDVKEATLAAMRSPIGSAPLKEVVKSGDKVCLVVADITRAWNRASEFLIYVVDELNLAGIPDKDICIVFAQGTHRPHTDEENITCVGEEVARRITMYQHISTDKSQQTYLGKTTLGTEVWIDKRVVDADKVILINAISTHDMAGFGGGRKLILPGVAGDETIQINHCHALGEKFGSGINPKTRSTLLDDNPVSDDMQEASDMVKPAFLVHSVINSEGKICRMVGGDPYEAWLEGTKLVYKTQKVPYTDKADIVFACAGGYPKDVSLYQGSKCYDPSDVVTKKGGVIIAIMEASDIYEPAAYLDSFKYETEADMEKALREHFTIPFFVAFNLFCMTHQYTIILVTKPENFEAIRKTNQIPVATVEEAWEIAKKKMEDEGKKDYTITVMAHCASIVPYKDE